MYKLLFLDLDGTLLKDDKTVSDNDVNAIKAARKAGVRVMIATGRPTIGAERSLKAIGYEYGDYLISNNGASILSLPDYRIRELLSISIKDHRKIDRFCKSQGLEHYSFDATTCLSERLHDYTLWEQQANGIEVKVVDFSAMDESTELLKIMAFGQPNEITAAMAAVPLAMRNDYAVIRSADILLEFLHPLATKGHAVETIADWLGINQHEIICIGDSGNDIDMVSYAGLGLAMGNAKPELIAAADDVTDSNENSGIAKAIYKYILN